MTQAQLDTLNSLPYQFAAVWRKLGGHYASMSEADLHRLAHEKKITAKLRSSWEEYPDTEVRRLIGFLLALLSGYKTQWTKHWQAEKAAREQSLLEDINIVDTCLTYDQVKDWMRANDTFNRPCERFEFVKSIQGVGYYRKRDSVLRHLTDREARQEYELYNLSETGRTFDQLYKLHVIPGEQNVLFTRLFSLGQSNNSQES